MALFSIVVPIFNSEDTIFCTILSIKKQDFYDFECLIVDDGSTDDSLNIVHDLIKDDKRFIVFKNKINKGVVSSRNLAIRKAKGRFLTFLDADDIWHPSFLRKSLEIRLKANQEIAITHSPYYRFKVLDGKFEAFSIKPPNEINYKNILKKNFMPFLTTCIDRKIVGDFKLKEIRPEDYKLWIDLVYLKKFSSISLGENLAYYRISQNQRSKNKFSAIKRIYKFFGTLPNSNIFNQIKNTLYWSYHNIIQRVNTKINLDKFSRDYLNYILFKKNI